MADPYRSFDRLVIVHTPQVQRGVRQNAIELPQAVKTYHVDQVIDEEHQDNVEEHVIRIKLQHKSQK